VEGVQDGVPTRAYGGASGEIVPVFKHRRPAPISRKGTSTYPWLDCPVGGAILFRKKLSTVVSAYKSWRKHHRTARFQLWVSREDGRVVAKRIS
jgi:hypothetical protein